jgi:hypothetical protein
MSTVERPDSLPDGSSGYAQMVVAALAPLAASDSGLRATVYVYQGPSVNFGNYGYSAFFELPGTVASSLRCTPSAARQD